MSSFWHRSGRSWAGLITALACSSRLLAATNSPVPTPALQPQFSQTAEPLLRQYCYDCHNAEKHKGDLDLTRFRSTDLMAREPGVWEGVVEQVRLGEMPPKDKPQPSAVDRERLLKSVNAALEDIALAQAGDPGPVVLRRLNNAEYTYTLRDLTGVASLNPAREFPADSAAGEGFMNTGNALVMSPALLAKYLDAGKEVASHAILLPSGIRFSEHTTERDWTDELLTQIRTFYRQFADDAGEAGGRLPLPRYFAATLEERAALTRGTKTVEVVAQERHLNARYLGALWRVLNDPAADATPSLLADLRQRWLNAHAEDAAALAAYITRWQEKLWKFNTIGHIRRHLGGTDGPVSWMEAVSPVNDRLDVRLKLNPATNASEVVVYLAAGDAGDGSAHDVVEWKQPQLVVPGRPNLMLRDVRTFAAEMNRRRERVFASTSACLAAAAFASAQTGKTDIGQLAEKFQVEADVLTAWLDYLGIGTEAEPKLDYFTGRIEKSGEYDFVRGWGSNDTPLLLANGSGQAVRIPGNLKAHGVVVHPSPTLNACVGWRSPITGNVRIEATVTHAHPECGNGVTWSLELRRGATRQRLAAGFAQGGTPVKIPAVENLAVQTGDLVSVVIGPRDGNHSCDLTDVDLQIRGAQAWNLSDDVSADILAGNPHADRQGHPAVWQFYTEPVSGAGGTVIPAGSLLARWQSSSDPTEKTSLATQIQTLLTAGVSGSTAAPDVQLHRQLSALSGPLFAGARSNQTPKSSLTPGSSDGPAWGLDPKRFGSSPGGTTIDPTSLAVTAPEVLEIHLPADLVAGCEFVTTGTLIPSSGPGGSVQLLASTTRPNWVGLNPDLPVLTPAESATRQRVEQSFNDFRQLFPAALCYTKIVPVDEAVTLTLFYREDPYLQELMLNADQKAELNRLWDELFFVSREPIQLQAAFEQIYEYATQDRPDMVKSFGPMREPVQRRAAAFRQRQVDAQPKQLDAVLDLAQRAYRRPLSPTESSELRTLYAQLRKQDIPHEEAIRLTLARVWVAPAFLYRLEEPAPGPKPTPVNDWELATRLSYFLWSSAPDEELRSLAQAGRLSDPDVLAAQTRRLLRDPRVRRLAEEFGCAWLHIHDFASLDEKSERHFPTFAGLRESMYEESIRCFTDFFQNNRPVVSLLDADYTFLNAALAEHYGIPGVQGPDWQKVEGVKAYGRGGILGQASTLAKQSGASRTSPILRGNWLCETLLGEKLPRPPKGVPVLPEVPPQGLTERQLTEQHSSDPKCAGCHVRIDPYGFSLEGYDAIGRRRRTDAAGLAIETRARLADGTEFVGLEGLREYLVHQRQDAFLHQFYRKLLGYALGRSVQLSDKPLIEQIQRTLASRGQPVGEAIELIVLSPQFREIRGRDFVTSN